MPNLKFNIIVDNKGGQVAMEQFANESDRAFKKAAKAVEQLSEKSLPANEQAVLKVTRKYEQLKQQMEAVAASGRVSSETVAKWSQGFSQQLANDIKMVNDAHAKMSQAGTRLKEEAIAGQMAADIRRQFSTQRVREEAIAGQHIAEIRKKFTTQRLREEALAEQHSADIRKKFRAERLREEALGAQMSADIRKKALAESGAAHAQEQTFAAKTWSTTRNLLAAAPGFAVATAAIGALYAALRSVKDEFIAGLKAVEEYNVAVASMSAFITTFSHTAAGGDLAGGFKEAHAYAQRLHEALEIIDQKTIATGKDLNVMAETMMQHGVLLDIDNKKQVQGFTNIANALALVTAGQNKDIQVRQEINALLTGQVRTTDRLPRLLQAIDPKLKEHLEIWNAQGIAIEKIGEMLSGFGASALLIENTWATIGSSLETIHKRILREGFLPAYTDLTALANNIKDSLVDADGALTPLARKLQSGVAEVYDDISVSITAIKAIWDAIPGWALELGLAGSIMFGKKGVALVVGGAVLFDWLKDMSRLAGLASAGTIKWDDMFQSTHDSRKKILDDFEKSQKPELDSAHAPKMVNAAREKAIQEKIQAIRDEAARKEAENQKAIESAMKAAQNARDSFIQSLEKQNATWGMSKGELLAYEASLLNLSATERQHVAVLIDMVDAREQAVEKQKEAEQAAKDYEKALQEQDKAIQEIIKRHDEYKAAMSGIDLELMPDIDRQAAEIIAKYDEVRAKVGANFGQLEPEEVKIALGKIDQAESKAFLAEVENLAASAKETFNGLDFGNELADGLDKAVQAMQSLTETLEKQAKLRDELEAQKSNLANMNAEDQIKALAAIDTAEKTMLQGQMTGYRQLFGTTSQLFKENSRERRVMHNMEMAFAAVEIAINMQKALTAAVAAIANQGAGDPYSAFARIAAMTALMGGVLAMAGGSLGSASTQPASVSGTVFGDSEATSDSITAIGDLLESIHADEYVQLKGINRGVQGLNLNIMGLVNNILRRPQEFGGGETITSSLLGGGAATILGHVGLGAGMAAGLLGSSWSAAGAAAGGFAGLAALGAGELLQALGWEDNPISGLLDKFNDLVGGFLGGGKSSFPVAGGISFTGVKDPTEWTGGGIADRMRWLRANQPLGKDGEWKLSDIKAGDIPIRAFTDIQTDKDGALWGTFGGSSSTSTHFSELDKTTADMLNMVLDGISSSLYSLGDVFGVSEQAIGSYTLKLSALDLKDLDGEELNKKLVEYFSALGDTAADDLFGDIIGKYKQVGEGALETAARLVTQQVVVTSVLKQLNIGLEGTSDVAAKAVGRFGGIVGVVQEALGLHKYEEIPNNLLAISDALVNFAGSLENFQQISSTYYDKFFTDEEKQADIKRALESQLSVLDSGAQLLPNTRETFRALVEGMNILDEAGQRDFITLLKLSEMADAYYSTLEDGAKKLYDEQIRLSEKQINAFKSLYESIVAARKSMAAEGTLSGTLSIQGQLVRATTAARRGDFSLAQELKGSLNNIVKKDDYATFAQYQEAFYATYNTLGELQKLTGKKLSYEAQNLLALDKGNELALAALAVLQQIQANTSGTVLAVPGFAGGGTFPGGLRIVGESGPELERTGPSEIFKNGTMFTADNTGLVAEMRRLQQLVAQGNYDTKQQAKKTADILDRWDRTTLPPLEATG